ncbi:MAG TPA: phosphatidylserine decarboxylase family protein [Pyrinomonadaceae bacterium]|nr:phosphatidylserine decarboxylase family protein [Pyrinomonadaceae bacterium]
MRIARDGLFYIAIPAIIAAILFGIGYWALALPFVIVSAFMIYFFRDPHRLPPSEPDIVVAPADGRVTRVVSLVSGAENSPTLISIFLSPLDVHINRSPIAGRVTDVSYTRGKFLMATNEQASLVNEQNALTIEGDKVSVVCKQIAGILARRIVCWKRKNDQVTRGERIGLIKFSSRTDLVLPANVRVTVTEGMKVQGGTTIIGRIQP